MSDLATFYRKTKSARKIIVVDLGFLGDTIHLLPCLWEIKRNYPQAQLHVVTTSLGCEVLGLVACVDHSWEFPLGPKSPPWWKHWDIIRALRRERFDLAFNFSGADRTIFITALTGAKWRMAYRGARKHFWSKWLIPHWVERMQADAPVFERRRQVLRECGLELAEPKFDVSAPGEAKRWADSNVPAGGIHVSINASSSIKEWPLSSWTELARTLAQENLFLLATGSSREREQTRLSQFATSTNSEQVKIFPGGLTIAQLAALLSKCQLHIGGDSGVLHLAMALNLPTVSIFRDYSDSVEWVPRGPTHRHIRAQSLDQITASTVAAQVWKILKLHR